MWGDDPIDFDTVRVENFGDTARHIRNSVDLPGSESLSCGCEVHLVWPQVMSSQHPAGCIATGIVPCKFHRGGHPEAEKQACQLAKDLYRRYVERFVKSNEQ